MDVTTDGSTSTESLTCAILGASVTGSPFFFNVKKPINSSAHAAVAVSHLSATIFGFSLTALGSILIFPPSPLLSCSDVSSSSSISTSPLSNSANISLYSVHSSPTACVRKYSASICSSATLVSPAMNLLSSWAIFCLSFCLFIVDFSSLVC